VYTIKEIYLQEWEKRWQNCQSVNLLQSWQYGDAKQAIENWRPYRFLILNENADEIALVQVLVKNIPIIGAIARINRGPLIIEKVEKQNQDIIAINGIDALISEFRSRGWRMLQIAPELNGNKNVISSLRNFGLRQLSEPTWASGLLSLIPSEDEILMGLNGKWRNCLRKGLRSGISIKKADVNTQNLQIVTDAYEDLKKDKNFSGISRSLIKALSRQNSHNWGLNLFIANETESDQTVKPIGTLVSVRHGDTSIYLIGTTNYIGRKLNANYALLWTAILKAKNDGCQWFDIGGLNKTTPPGVAHFKKGLNAKLYALTGEWRLFNLPWKRIK